MQNNECRMSNIEPQKLGQHFEIHYSLFDILRFKKLPRYLLCKDRSGSFEACAQARGNKALKARRSTAQGGGRKAAVTLGGHEKDTSPEGAAQSASPFQGLAFMSSCIPGLHSPLRVLFHPGLCYAALSALSLTLIPSSGRQP